MQITVSERVSMRSVKRAVRKLLMIFAGLVAVVELHAQNEFVEQRGWLHLNGLAHHFVATDCNDQLLGIGFTQYRRRYGSLIPAWEFDAFQDSARKLSAYVGHSWTMPTKYVSFGVTGAVMYHRNFGAQNEFRLLPVAIPFLETRGARWKARIYYVPPLRSPTDHQIALQLVMPLFR